jgi:hypothetical protein
VLPEGGPLATVPKAAPQEAAELAEWPLVLGAIGATRTNGAGVEAVQFLQPIGAEALRVLVL